MLDRVVTSLSTVCGNVYPQIPTARMLARGAQLFLAPGGGSLTLMKRR